MAKKTKYLWVKTTKDKYELPIFVCDTAEELARLSGVKVDTIRSEVCRGEGHYHKVAIGCDVETRSYAVLCEIETLKRLVDEITDDETFNMVELALAELYDRIKKGGKNGQN